MWVHWGAFGAVNPSGGLVANSRGVGEEEQLECLQPSQLRADKCIYSTSVLAGTSQKPVLSFCRRLRKTLLSFHRNGNPSLSVEFDWCRIEMNFKANSHQNC